MATERLYGGRSFAAVILTHGRADRVWTTTTLRRSGYTGRIIYVIDTEDPAGEEYRERFGAEDVVVFDKAEIEDQIDVADTTGDRRAVVYARNAVYRIARDLGLDYILVLDDDYGAFYYRYVDRAGKLRHMMMQSFDDLAGAFLDFLDASGAATVAFSQGGDHFGGDPNNVREGLRRKAMNSFFLRTDRPVEFLGKVNEDTTAYVVHGSRGDLFFTVMGVQLNQPDTQSNAGGLTDIYLDMGTYVKSFYTVLMAPSCVKIRTMGRYDRRYHHNVTWDHAVPKILNERYRKPRRDRAAR